MLRSQLYRATTQTAAEPSHLQHPAARSLPRLSLLLLPSSLQELRSSWCGVADRDRAGTPLAAADHDGSAGMAAAALSGWLGLQHHGFWLVFPGSRDWLAINRAKQWS